MYPVPLCVIYEFVCVYYVRTHSPLQCASLAPSVPSTRAPALQDGLHHGHGQDGGFGTHLAGAHGNTLSPATDPRAYGFLLNQHQALLSGAETTPTEFWLVQLKQSLTQLTQLTWSLWFELVADITARTKTCRPYRSAGPIAGLDLAGAFNELWWWNQTWAKLPWAISYTLIWTNQSTWFSGHITSEIQWYFLWLTAHCSSNN